MWFVIIFSNYVTSRKDVPFVFATISAIDALLLIAAFCVSVITSTTATIFLGNAICSQISARRIVQKDMNILAIKAIRAFVLSCNLAEHLFHFECHCRHLICYGHVGAIGMINSDFCAS